MRHRTLKEAQEALAKALKDLEATRMTRPDDPELSELKADIRRVIQRVPPQSEVVSPG